MSVFLDSFDLYDTTALMAVRWDEVTMTGTGTTHGPRVGLGWGGSTGYRMDIGPDAAAVHRAYLRKAFTPQSCWTIGLAFYYRFLHDIDIMSVGDSGVTQVDIVCDDGVLRATRNGTVLVSPTRSGTQIPFGEWIYLEMQVVIHPTQGSVVVRRDRVEYLRAGPMNTSATGNAWGNEIVIGNRRVPTTGTNAVNGAPKWRTIDDVYIVGEAALQPFLGWQRIYPVMPASDVQAQFVPSGGPPNAGMVAERPPVEATYNGSDILGTGDLFALQALPPRGSDALVPLVQGSTYARSPSGAPWTLVPQCRSAGVTVEGGLQTLDATSRYGQAVWTVDPATGQPWTAAGVQQAAFGYRRGP